jgi:hypothetical protein
MLEEQSFTCPYCWQQIPMLLDLSAGQQSYIEDCENCCRPIAISFDVEGDEVTSFAADPVA